MLLKVIMYEYSVVSLGHLVLRAAVGDSLPRRWIYLMFLLPLGWVVPTLTVGHPLLDPVTGWTDQTLLHIRQQQTMVANFEACRREIKWVSPKHPSPAPTIIQDLSSGCVAVYRRPGWNLNFLSRRHYKPRAGPPAVEDTWTRSRPSP